MSWTVLGARNVTSYREYLTSWRYYLDNEWTKSVIIHLQSGLFSQLYAVNSLKIRVYFLVTSSLQWENLPTYPLSRRAIPQIFDLGSWHGDRAQPLLYFMIHQKPKVSVSFLFLPNPGVSILSNKCHSFSFYLSTYFSSHHIMGVFVQSYKGIFCTFFH